LSKKEMDFFMTSYLNRIKYLFSDEHMSEHWHCNNIFFQMNLDVDAFINLIKRIKNDDIKKVCNTVFNFVSMGIASLGDYKNYGLIDDIKNIKNTYQNLSPI